MEFPKYLAYIIIIIRCVPCKYYVDRLKVKATLHSYILCIGCNEPCSCLAHDFVLHGWISKLFDTNYHRDKMMWLLQESYHKLEGQGHSADITCNYVNIMNTDSCHIRDRINAAK